MGDVHFLHAAPAPPWRVQALAAMNPAELSQAFAGDEAVDWLEAATACGLVEAQLKLGRMLLTGDGVACDRRAAFACFISAAGGGNAEARNLLGRCFENGWARRSTAMRRATVTGRRRKAAIFAAPTITAACWRRMAASPARYAGLSGAWPVRPCPPEFTCSRL